MPCIYSVPKDMSPFQYRLDVYLFSGRIPVLRPVARSPSKNSSKQFLQSVRS